ncbi:hypothetical protein B0A55_04750 [Friedmanniomyces simplex]|uniref:Uncharacterized protein n=1 Tax=Friedmanniomyces simplex TaxID=329884 RepID=A0A4V5NHB1_9PEZI|nr:hypothetical protein B0A55_04750 [Friedmanniomyces simplex]
MASQIIGSTNSQSAVDGVSTKYRILLNFGQTAKPPSRAGTAAFMFKYGMSTANSRAVTDAMRAIRLDWRRNGEGTCFDHRLTNVFGEIGVAVINGTSWVLARFDKNEQRVAEIRRKVLLAFREFEEHLSGHDGALPKDIPAFDEEDDEEEAQPQAPAEENSKPWPTYAQANGDESLESARKDWSESATGNEIVVSNLRADRSGLPKMLLDNTNATARLEEFVEAAREHRFEFATGIETDAQATAAEIFEKKHEPDIIAVHKLLAGNPTRLSLQRKLHDQRLLLETDKLSGVARRKQPVLAKQYARELQYLADLLGAMIHLEPRKNVPFSAWANDLLSTQPILEWMDEVQQHEQLAVVADDRVHQGLQKMGTRTNGTKKAHLECSLGLMGPSTDVKSSHKTAGEFKEPPTRPHMESSILERVPNLLGVYKFKRRVSFSSSLGERRAIWPGQQELTQAADAMASLSTGPHQAGGRMLHSEKTRAKDERVTSPHADLPDSWKAPLPWHTEIPLDEVIHYSTPEAAQDRFGAAAREHLVQLQLEVETEANLRREKKAAESMLRKREQAASRKPKRTARTRAAKELAAAGLVVASTEEPRHPSSGLAEATVAVNAQYALNVEATQDRGAEKVLAEQPETTPETAPKVVLKEIPKTASGIAPKVARTTTVATTNGRSSERRSQRPVLKLRIPSVAPSVIATTASPALDTRNRGGRKPFVLPATSAHQEPPRTPTGNLGQKQDILDDRVDSGAPDRTDPTSHTTDRPKIMLDLRRKSNIKVLFNGDPSASSSHPVIEPTSPASNEPQLVVYSKKLARVARDADHPSESATEVKRPRPQSR